MSTYNQDDRHLTLTTPLGPNKLFIVGMDGTEAISQLFHFHLDLIALNGTKIPFEDILGKKVTAHVLAKDTSVTPPVKKVRHFSGICNRISQGGRDQTFTSYRVEIVPAVWFLTRKSRSRIFQGKSVKQILETVFEGLGVKVQPKQPLAARDYCVQYRETDFNFASRLMEEEGLFYLFKHEANGHEMLVLDSKDDHPDVPFQPEATFAPLHDHHVDEDRVTDWEKAQDLRSMKFTLRDHSFELPGKDLLSVEPITKDAKVGEVTHQFVIGDAERLEIYDWPGEYAQRFDGVGPGRDDRPADVQKIFEDGKRTVKLRMEQEAASCLRIGGASKLRQLTAGHKFTLAKHFNADGAYILTAVHHSARMASNYFSGSADDMSYHNSFSCLPASIPFRPHRVTPKPVIQGTQTAVVVGPKGEELYTDKYGRVKVQFHWDREGKNDEKSSCWVRVAQMVAGKRWGGSFWPRIGQEVIVDHLEGDPDQPIIIGCVYNAEQMPPYLGKGPDSKHADDNLVSGIKSNTSKGGSGYNELRFVDAKDKQQVFIHAERNMDVRVKNDSMERVVGNRHIVVGKKPGDDKVGDLLEDVYRDNHLHIRRHQTQQVEGNVLMTVGKGQASDGGNVDIMIEKTKKELIGQDSHLHVTGARNEAVDKTMSLTVTGDSMAKYAENQHAEVGMNRNEKVGMNQSLTVGQNQAEKVGMNHSLDAGMAIYLKAGMSVVIEGGMELTLKAGGSFVSIGPSGVAISGPMIMLNSGGAAGSGSAGSPESPSAPTAPTDAQQAKPTEPAKADYALTGQKSSS